MAEWMNTVGTNYGALVVAAWALWRTTRRDDHSDVDRRIDERIALAIGADMAVIKNTLSAIQATIASTAGKDAAIVKAAVDATAGAIREQLLHDRDATVDATASAIREHLLHAREARRE